MTDPRPRLDTAAALPPLGSTPLDLLFFSDDWGRHPSSCQHLARELLGKHSIQWINTIGTRPPRLDRLTFQRGWQKARDWMRNGSAPGDGGDNGPLVVSPLMWPSFRSRWGRTVNRLLLGRACRRLPRAGAHRVAVTTLPIVADLVGGLAVDRWVYYCVDDLSSWPGLDRSTLEAMERELVAKVDRIVAVSDRLVERMASLGRAAVLLTHGVDLAHWSEAGSEEPHPLAALERPLVVFWGVLDRRLDPVWIERLSARLARGTIALVGPANNPHPQLASLANVHCPGALAYERLPQLARGADVLVMPYADMAATRAMQPLKLKEYLATGKPVVTSPLPAVEAWRDTCDVAGSADEFADLVLARISGGAPRDQQRARRRLASESWTSKAETFLRILLEPGDDGP